MEDQKPFDVRAKLAAELGRTPPEQPKEDYAPKAQRPNVGEHEIAQVIKDTMRDVKTWYALAPGEREALDFIATEISRICVGRKFWKELGEWATLGLEASDHD